MGKTKVLFLLETCQDTQATGEVFAYFPEEVHNGELKTCYAHIGQHSSCHPDYVKECKEANYNEYQDLLKELVSIGYNNLEILNKQEIECSRNPTPFEIKQGYGATHYRSFTVNNLIKPNGDLKRRFRADDGLFYNRY